MYRVALLISRIRDEANGRADAWHRPDVDRAGNCPVAPFVVDPQDVPAPVVGLIAEGRLQDNLIAFAGYRKRLDELAPPVELGRFQGIQAVDLGPQRVGAVHTWLERLARPLTVDRDEREEWASVRGEGAASANRINDRRVGQPLGLTVHAAIARRRRAPPASAQSV